MLYFSVCFVALPSISSCFYLLIYQSVSFFEQNQKKILQSLKNDFTLSTDFITLILDQDSLLKLDFVYLCKAHELWQRIFLERLCDEFST